MRRMGLEYLCIDEWIEFMVNVGKYCIWASDMNKVAIPMTDPWDVCIFCLHEYLTLYGKFR